MSFELFSIIQRHAAVFEVAGIARHNGETADARARGDQAVHGVPRPVALSLPHSSAIGFALVAVTGALALIRTTRPSAKPRLDIPGTLAASTGLFMLVYGFSQASTHGWTATITDLFLAAGVALLGLFVAIERRSSHPLLPLLVLADRNRGGSYLALLFAAVGMFGVFLFLTYYLQETLGYSPITTGLAFLPMAGLVVASATTSSASCSRAWAPSH